MKNLIVHSHALQDFAGKEFCDKNLHEILDDNALCSINPDTDDIYVLRKKKLCQISMRDGLKISSIAIDGIKGPFGPVGLEYFSDAKQLWCAYSSGFITTVATEEGLREEHTTWLPAGLKSMKLSPDQEIVALIAGDDTVYTTVWNFDTITQRVELNSTEYGENQFVTVGWGKKETQFHGSEGKAAAKVKTVTVPRTENDDGKPRISWRGDGTMFAVSFLQSDGNARLFKVFDREGYLQCTSELTTGLEPHVAWKPSGNLIATSQILPNKHVVTFFEKNGLKHREFSLPFKPHELDVIDIKWTYDSEVMSIWLKEPTSGETRLQLWTENNYHWYLKQTMKFSAENPLIHFAWSAGPRAGKKLILLTKTNTMTYTFCWRVDRSRGFSETDKGIVAVVDGYEALITGFRVGIVPPPMCHKSLKFEETINSIIFAPGLDQSDTWLDSNSFMCLLGHNQLALCLYSKDTGLLDYNHIGTYDIEWDSPDVIDTKTYSLHHFLWFKENLMLCSASSSTRSYLCVLGLEGEDFRKGGRVVVRETTIMDGHIEHVISSPDENVAYIVADKTVYRYTTDEGISPTALEIAESCTEVEVIEIDYRHIVISLTSRGRFFVDGSEIASNITSFTVHSEFLLLTTLQHALICVKLDAESFRQINQDLTIKPWENGRNEDNATGLSVRRVERGSNLIIAVAKDPRTILQMPRGNLECIQPRALSLHIIGTYLEKCDYTLAFDMIRKQRINLNLIYDHDPELFITNAEKFVDSIENPVWLSLFLSELQNDDVTATIYKSSYPNRPIVEDPKTRFLRNNKIERVCDILRDLMEKREDSRDLVQPILTSLVKNRQTFGLEAALRKIKEIRSHEDAEEGSSAENALRYLLYLVDVNVLFDIALGMYDFELALFVASKSQKDPKEYIPLLEDLKKREVNYMKYSIDKYLKRYETALNNIAKSPDKFDECLDFICTHDMYARALKIFPVSSKPYREIAKIYGDVLIKNEKYHEAAIMFTRAGYLEGALCAYKIAGSWQDVIVISVQLEMSPGDTQELYEVLVTSLTLEKRFREAAEILVTYLKQHEDAVSVLCEGREWRDAMRIVYSTKRLDLIETHIKPGVEDHAAHLLHSTIGNREKFEKYKIRLATVRQENAARDLRMQDPLGADYDFTAGGEISDLLSDTSSVAGSLASQSSRSSRSSGRSYRSKKNRRKQERKLLSIKEGSFYEDLALIRALHQITTVTYADKDEVRLVTQMLLTFGHDEVAEKLQNSFGDFIRLIECSKSEIWPKIGCDNVDTRDEMISLKDNHPGSLPQNLLEPRFMYPPEAGTGVWQLEIFSSAKEIYGNL